MKLCDLFVPDSEVGVVSPMATPVMARPIHSMKRLLDRAMVSHPSRKGIDTSCTVRLRPNHSMRSPERIAPKGLVITPRLAVT